MGTILEKLEYTNNAVKALRDTKIAKKVGINTSTPLKQIPPLLDSVNLNGGEGPDYFDETIDLHTYYTNDNYENFTVPYNCNQGGMVFYNNELHVFGGATDSISLYHFKHDGEKWIQMEDLPYAFCDGAFVVYNNEIHILGSSKSPYMKYHYSFNGMEWLRLDDLPYDFSNGTAIVIEDEIHIFGGASSATSHYKYNGTDWEEVDTLPYNFINGTAIIFEDEIHILGDNGEDSVSHYKYDGSSWIEISTLPFAFNNDVALIYRDNLYLINKGGQFYLFNKFQDSWIFINDLKVEDRSYEYALAYSNNDKIYVVYSKTAEENSCLYIFKENENNKDILLDMHGYSKDAAQFPSANGRRVFVYNNQIYTYNSSNYTLYRYNDDKWVKIDSMPFKNVAEAVVVYHNEIHFLGCHPNNVNGASYSHYKFDGNTWTTLSRIPYDFTNGAAIVYNDEIHILGGGGSHTQHYKYNGVGWEEVSTLSTTFSPCPVVIYDNEMYILGLGGKGVYKYNEEGWVRLSFLLPYQCYNGSAVVYNNEIHILGGSYVATNHYKYDGTEWSEVSTLPRDFSYNSTVIYNNEIHIFGGKSSSEGYHYKYDGSIWYNYSNFWHLGVEWVSIPDTPISLSYNQMACVFNNEIHIINGTDHYKYDNNNNIWTNVSTLPFRIENGYGIIVVYNNEIHILGNAGAIGSINSINHYKYDGNSWNRVSYLPYSFYYGSAVVYNNEIHILGGGNSVTKHYKYDGSSWSEVSTLPYRFYRGPAVVYNNEIHILGGASSTINHYKYDGSSWSFVRSLPYNFTNGSAVVYNNEIHILGGSSSPEYYYHYKYNNTSGWIELPKLPYKHSSSPSFIYNDEIYLITTSMTNHYKLALKSDVSYKNYYMGNSSNNRYYPYKSLFDNLEIVSMRSGHYDNNILDLTKVVNKKFIPTYGNGKIYSKSYMWNHLNNYKLSKSTDININCEYQFISSASEPSETYVIPITEDATLPYKSLIITRPNNLASVQISTEVGKDTVLAAATTNNAVGTSYAKATFAAATLNRPFWLLRVIHIDATQVLLVYQWQTTDTALSAIFGRTIFIEETGNIRLGTERTLFAATNLYNSGLAYTLYEYDFMPARYGKRDYIIFNYLYTNYSSAGVATQQRPMYNRLMHTATSVNRDMALGTVAGIGGFAAINPSTGSMSYEVFPSKSEGAYARFINALSLMSSIKGYIHVNSTAGVNSVTMNIGTAVNGILANRSFGTGILGVLNNGDYITCSSLGNGVKDTFSSTENCVYIERLTPLANNRATFKSMPDNGYHAQVGAIIGNPISQLVLSRDTSVTCNNTILLKNNLLLKMDTGNIYQIIYNKGLYSIEYLGTFDVELLATDKYYLINSDILGDQFYEVGTSYISS